MSTQLALQPIYTIEGLINACRTIEDAKVAAARFRPPPANVQQLLEPDLAYTKGRYRPAKYTLTDSVGAPHSLEQPINYVPSESPNAQSFSGASAMTCWNCNQTGHRFNQCTSVKRKHCYRCGQPNVTSKECPKCAGNGRRAQ